MSRAHVRLLQQAKKLLQNGESDRICFAVNMAEGVLDDNTCSNTAWEVKRHISLHIAQVAYRPGGGHYAMGRDHPTLSFSNMILPPDGHACQYALDDNHGVFGELFRKHVPDPHVSCIEVSAGERAARVEFIDTVLIPYWETHQGNGRPIKHKEHQHG
jgi:hypothetical protein